MLFLRDLPPFGFLQVPFPLPRRTYIVSGICNIWNWSRRRWWFSLENGSRLHKFCRGDPGSCFKKKKEKAWLLPSEQASSSFGWNVRTAQQPGTAHTLVQPVLCSARVFRVCSPHAWVRAYQRSGRVNTQNLRLLFSTLLSRNSPQFFTPLVTPILPSI